MEHKISITAKHSNPEPSPRKKIETRDNKPVHLHHLTAQLIDVTKRTQKCLTMTDQTDNCLHNIQMEAERIHSEKDDQWETLNAKVLALETEIREHTLTFDEHIRRMADKEYHKKRKLIKGYELQMKELKKQNESYMIDLKNLTAYIKRSENAWQMEQVTLQDTIKTEKRNCQRALEASAILKTKEKGFEKEMERKRKFMDENNCLANANRCLNEGLAQKSTAYEQLTEKVKEKENEIKSIKTSNIYSTDKMNKEIRTLKENLFETENCLTTLQETYDKAQERLCKLEDHIAITDNTHRTLDEDDNRTDLRLKEMEDEQKVQQTVLEQMEQRAVSTEQQLEDKQKEIECFERTMDRLQSECKVSKLSFESEQEKTRRLESRMKTTEHLEDENRKLYSTIEKIKKETDDSEKRLQENPGFHTQELILMNRLKELFGSMQTNRKYEYNSSNRRIIKSYNINNSQVFFNNKSLIRHGNSEDC